MPRCRPRCLRHHNVTTLSCCSDNSVCCWSGLCLQRVFSGRWQCTADVCSQTCSVLGFQHFQTFDGRRYKSTDQHATTSSSRSEARTSCLFRLTYWQPRQHSILRDILLLCFGNLMLVICSAVRQVAFSHSDTYMCDLGFN